MVSLLYLCVSVIVYLHSCIDNYNIEKVWTCILVLVVAWSDTFVRSLSRTTRASLTRNWPGFPWKWGHFIRDTSSRPHLSRPGTRLLWNIVEPTLHFQHSPTAALFQWRLLLWLEEGQRAEEVRLYSLENLLSSHPPLLRDTGFNIDFISYFFIQWKSCHFYFLLPKTQFILKICSIWS